ncbi:family 20 glycosylhydrolase [Halosquirtibacter laminarini]|uniref:Family 20 glycosylhydrolase n=1 Tax=Halosquirtibacter laminarini TaxID=3374600 RepID=A0AC61ND76_9BACT|nr:family 20 glycosylhydrolase [Prolixibacteraceae bacterium]
MRNNIITTCFFLFFIVLFYGCKDTEEKSVSTVLLPRAKQEIHNNGTFVSSSTLKVMSNTALLRGVEKIGSEILKNSVGVTLERSKTDINIKLFLIKSSAIPKEGYQLSVSEEGIVIKAVDKCGILYGLQSLSQLVRKIDTDKIEIPFVKINDSPKYPYRGLDLDLCRHFYKIKDLKSLIDVMSYLKMNKLILELADDEGWRIEIKSLPKLQSISAFRSSIGFTQNQVFGHNKDDKSVYGGYYTQSEMRDLVRYAKYRNVEIIPQVEVANHLIAASRAYHFLECTSDEAKISGELSSTTCYSNDRCLKFWDQVIGELSHVFESPYIHVGGGVIKCNLDYMCESCQNLVKSGKFKTTEAIHFDYMKKIETLVHKYGKKVLGWNKVYRYSKDPSSMAMVWQSTQAARFNVKNNHPVILCPQRKFSFKMDQNLHGDYKGKRGVLTLRDVYDFIPSFSKVDSKFLGSLVKGVSAILWTPNSPTFDVACMRLFPRLFAVSELGWYGFENKDWDNFRSRQQNMIRYVNDRMMAHGKLSHKVFFKTIKLDNGQLGLTLSNDAGDPIRYTVDGSKPDIHSALYTTPIPVDGLMIVKALPLCNDGLKSQVFGRKLFDHKALFCNVRYKYPYSYDLGECRSRALVDGIVNNYQTIELEDMDVTLDLGEEKEIFHITTKWASRPKKSIFEPKSVIYKVSKDGVKFRTIFQMMYSADSKESHERLVECFPGGLKARYINVIGKNRRINPSWHNFPDRYSWLNLDEVVIE